MCRPLQRGAKVRKPTQGQGQLLFQQAKELPGALALGLDLLSGGLRPEGQAGFLASAGKRTAGEQLQHLVKL